MRAADRRFSLTPRVLELGYSFLSSLTLPGDRPAAPARARRAGPRVLVGVGARRRRHRLRRARADAADHDRRDLGRDALPGVRDLDGPRAARRPRATRSSTRSCARRAAAADRRDGDRRRTRCARELAARAPAGLGARRPGARGRPALGRRADPRPATGGSSRRSTSRRTRAGRRSTRSARRCCRRCSRRPRGSSETSPRGARRDRPRRDLRRDAPVRDDDDLRQSRLDRDHVPHRSPGGLRVRARRCTRDRSSGSRAATRSPAGSRRSSTCTRPPGLGNAVNAIANARDCRAPLVIVVGQQDRRQMSFEPFLTGRALGASRGRLPGVVEPAGSPAGRAGRDRARVPRGARGARSGARRRADGRLAVRGGPAGGRCARVGSARVVGGRGRRVGRR